MNTQINYIKNNVKKLKIVMKTLHKYKFFIFYIAVLLCCFDTANAVNFNEMKRVRSYHAWDVYIDAEKGCHAISKPVESKAFNGIRNIPYIVMSYHKLDRYTFSMYAGYALNQSKEPSAIINNKTFALRLNREFFAYTYDSSDDVEIFNNAIADGKYIKIRTYSVNNETALDYYSLQGFLKAARFMQKKCN